MSSSRTFTGWIIGLLVLVIGLIAGLKVWGNRTPAVSLTNRELAMSCTTDMATEFHIHPKLIITIDGKDQPIPSGIGIKNGCMNPLHTHDEPGVIHVESPEPRDFMLGDWFAVWGKAFTKDQILDAKVDEKHSIRVRVNGQEVDTFEQTVLRDAEQIVISYEEKK